MPEKSTLTRLLAAIRTIPSSDLGFEAHVQFMAARSAARSPESLEDCLRRIYPRARVRAREISGERPTWYVYRDGHWVLPQDGRWWETPGLPHVVVDTEGWIRSANEPAAELLGASPASLAGRHSTDFVIPGTLEDAEAMREILVRVGETTSVVRFLAADGTVRTCEHHTQMSDGQFEVTFRPQRANDGWGPPVERAGERIDLSCYPEADVAFARYANILLDRLPDPTPQGLGMRIRRIYPHAEVRAVSSVAWRAYRDGFAARRGLDALWWLDPDLPRIEMDLEGLVLAANAPAERQLSTSLRGRHIRELMSPDAVEDVERLAPILRELGVFESTFRFVTPDGAFWEAEYHTEIHGEQIMTVFRPLPGPVESVAATRPEGASARAAGLASVPQPEALDGVVSRGNRSA